MLIVGTSGVVYPAAAMPLIAKEAGATVIDVNPERDALAPTCDLFLQGPGGEVLPGWSPPCASTWPAEPGGRGSARRSLGRPAGAQPRSPGLRPAARAATPPSTRRARVSARFASSTQ